MKLNLKNNRFEHKLLTRSLAMGYPFTQTNFIDKNGIYLGNTIDNQPIVVDFFKKNNERNSHSSVIFGMNGKGKTMLISKLIKDKALNTNNKVIVIDPKRDYKNLVTNMGGVYIDMSGVAKDCPSFNPFEVFVKHYEDNTNPLLMHYRFLSDFFKILFPDITLQQQSMLDNAIRSAYTNKGIKEHTDFTKLNSKSYPIIEDVYKEINKLKYKEANDLMNRNTILAFLENYRGDGNYNSIWNKPTNINVDKTHLICFDIQKLITSSSGDNNLANAQLFLMLKWMYSQIVENKDHNDKLKKGQELRWIDIFVDEGHVLTTHKNKTPLHFLFTMYKTIRGFSGGVHFITQNIAGLVGNHDTKEMTTGMLDNAQYLFIFGLAPNDIKNLDALFDIIGGLTDAEKDFLSAAQIGECIFAPFTKLRFNLKVKITAIEQKVFKEEIDYSKIDDYFPKEESNETEANTSTMESIIIDDEEAEDGQQ